ncbi:MAG: hypothetical protein U0794_07015 [Isosphaeraceae bacterium]
MTWATIIACQEKSQPSDPSGPLRESGECEEANDRWWKSHAGLNQGRDKRST